MLTKGTQIPDVINYGPKKRERGAGIEKGTGDKIQNQPEVETYWIWGRVRGNEHGDNSSVSGSLKMLRIKAFGLSHA